MHVVFDAMFRFFDLEGWLGDGRKFVEKFVIRAVDVVNKIHRI